MNKVISLAAALTLLAAPSVAMAGDFDGFRIGATAGLDDVTSAPDATDVTYGVDAGYDVNVSGPLYVGVEASLDNVFDRRDVGAAVRVGLQVADPVLVYGKVGYANFKDSFSRDLDGLRLGAGVETSIAGNLYGKVEYRYTDFEAGVGKHGGLVGIGLRF